MQFYSCVTFRLTVFGILCLASAASAQFEIVPDDPFGAPRVAPAEPQAKEAPKNSAPAKKDDNAPVIQPKIKELPPSYVKLYLVDGDVVSGELATPSISIKTDFGTLAVPVEKIVRFEPGLNSYPKILEHISKLVSDLGSTKYEEREAAHKALVAMGPRIQNELAQFDGEANAEMKRHLAEIKKEIAKVVEEFDEDDLEDPENQPWDRDDKLVMANFTAVGKIQESDFKLKGKYGELAIKLGDIRKGTRPVAGRQPIQKSLTVNKDNFVQLAWKSAGIMVQKGDSLTVSASGTITLTPWGSNAVSTPNGTPQYGTMPNTPGIPYGALVAKIGNGKYFKVGDKKTFRADAKGKLQFAITMRASYVGKSYQYPGDYKLKIKVEPAPQQ